MLIQSQSAILTRTTGTLSPVTPPTGAIYIQFGKNGLVLDPGYIWQLFWRIKFGSNGSNPSYSAMLTKLYAANGANTGAAPASLDSNPNIGMVGQDEWGLLLNYFTSGISTDYYLKSSTTVRVMNAPVTVYYGAYMNLSTPANGRIEADITAYTVGRA